MSATVASFFILRNTSRLTSNFCCKPNHLFAVASLYFKCAGLLLPLCALWPLSLCNIKEAKCRGSWNRALSAFRKPYLLDIRCTSACRNREHSHWCLRRLWPLHHDAVWIYYRPHVANGIDDVLFGNLRTIPDPSSSLWTSFTNGTAVSLNQSTKSATKIFTTSLLYSEFPNDGFRVVVCKDICYFGE